MLFKKLSILLFVIVFFFQFIFSAPIEVYFNRPPSSNGLDKALIKLIDSAQKYVWAHFYQVNYVPVIQAFVRAAKRLGPQNVKFITDDHYYYSEKYKKYYKMLEAAGIKIVTDRESKTKGRGQSHNKFCIVDDKYVWTGSYNITVNGTFYNNNNAVLLTSPEIATAYKKEFLEMYEERLFGKYKKDNIRHIFNVAGTTVEVYMSPSDHVADEIVDEVKGADLSLYFVMFSFTNSEIISAMAEQIKRKHIKIKGYLDNLQAKSKYSIWKKLTGFPLEIRQDRSRAMVHHKFMVIDPFSDSDPVVITGSFNFTKGADKKNDENVVIIHNSSIATKYYLEFLRLFSGKEALPPNPQTKLELVKLSKKEVVFKLLDDGYEGRGVDLSGLLVGDPLPFFSFSKSFRLKKGEELWILPLEEKKKYSTSSKKGRIIFYYPFHEKNYIHTENFTYEVLSPAE